MWPLASNFLQLSIFQEAELWWIRDEGGLVVAEGYPTFESEAVRQAQSTKIPRAAYRRLFSRDSAQSGLDKWGIDGKRDWHKHHAGKFVFPRITFSTNRILSFISTVNVPLHQNYMQQGNMLYKI